MCKRNAEEILKYMISTFTDYLRVDHGPVCGQVDGGAALPIAHRKGEAAHRLLQAADLPCLVGNRAGEAVGRHLQGRDVSLGVCALWLWPAGW